MLKFLPQGHKFQVAPIKPQLLEFGKTRFFTSLAVGMPLDQLEQSLAGGAPLFGNPLVFPAVSFHAECIVVMEKATSPQFPEIHLRQNFDFGFVQGIRCSDFHVDFWGQHPKHGTTSTHISMPNTFEVDTAPPAQPFTRVPEARFEIRNVTQAESKFNFIRISSDMTDHPLYAFDRVLKHRKFGTDNFVRFVSFQNEFRTIFCVREKKTGEFTSISATAWTIRYRHKVSYRKNGQEQVVSDDSGGPMFLGSGSPDLINETDRQIMQIAKTGPFLTPAVLQHRFSTTFPQRTVTIEDENPDFESDFWK